jgi:hypothetical protein
MAKDKLGEEDENAGAIKDHHPHNYIGMSQNSELNLSSFAAVVGGTERTWQDPLAGVRTAFAHTLFPRIY